MEKKISVWTKQWMMKKKQSFHFLEELKSSNDMAKENSFKELPSPQFFLTDRQSHGRGQGQKKWENSDLMISCLWEKNLKDISLSSCEAFAKDLEQAIKKVWPFLPLFIKAPNDLYLGKKKLAGVLLEVLTQGSKRALIVGLGLNVFSCPNNQQATYLAEYTKPIDLKNWESFLFYLFSFWNKRASFNSWIH